jgi:hypothetical protein
MRLALLAVNACFLCFLAAPAAAQPQGAREPEWRTAVEADILLHPFRYEPREIRPQAGRPVLLQFVNDSRANLSFRAPAFFAAAHIRRGDRQRLQDGGFRLAPGARLRISLVPARGQYHAWSGYFIQRLRGMTARIVVE